MIAVGTTVTGRPPHRSVREELPHAAPPSGQTITKRCFATRRHCHAMQVTPFPARCPGRPWRSTTVPFGDSLSSTDSATAVAALFARVGGTRESSDFPAACVPAVPSVRFADRPRRRRQGADGISRFSRLKFPYMRQVFDSAVLDSCLPSNARTMLPSAV